MAKKQPLYPHIPKPKSLASIASHIMQARAKLKDAVWYCTFETEGRPKLTPELISCGNELRDIHLKLLKIEEDHFKKQGYRHTSLKDLRKEIEGE